MKLIRDQDIVLGITLLDFAPGFHLPSSFNMCGGKDLVALLLLLAAFAGCRRAQDRPAHETNLPGVQQTTAALSLVPPETRTLLYLDLDRVRGQAGWNPLLGGLVRAFGPALEGLFAATGFEPTHHVHRLWVALPGEPENDDRFALLADVDSLDEARMTAWLRGRTGDALVAYVRNHSQLVVASGAWKTPMLGLGHHDGLSPSAAGNQELRRLCERQASQHGVWFASLVTPRIRRILMEDGRFPDAASIARIAGHVDLDTGLHVELVGELTNTPDSSHLARRLVVYLNQAKRDPQMLVSGLSPYLEAVRIQAQGATVHASLDVPTGQVADVVERMEALAREPRTQ